MDAQAALYPLGGDDFIVGLAGGYDTLMPGETRTIRYAFVIYRNSFAEQAQVHPRNAYTDGILGR